MTLATHEFIRRFLMHVLPKGLHRIRHYALFANGNRAENLARMRELLTVIAPVPEAANAAAPETPEPLVRPCPCCGGRMFIVETFQAGAMRRARPSPSTMVIRIDTS
jgi:Putative transposase